MATGRGKSLIFHLHAARTALRARPRERVRVPAARARRRPGVPPRGGVRRGRARGPHGDRRVEPRRSATRRSRRSRTGALDVVLTTPEFLHLHAAALRRRGQGRLPRGRRGAPRRACRAPGTGPRTRASARRLELLGEPDGACGHRDRRRRDRRRRSARLLGVTAIGARPHRARQPRSRGHARHRRTRTAISPRSWPRASKTVVYVNSREQSVQARAHAAQARARTWRCARRSTTAGCRARPATPSSARFAPARSSVVVATSAFGEGVNIPDIRNVVLYHLPFNDVEFNQMSGRAGRDGAHGAHPPALRRRKDARINEMILSSLAPSRDDMAALYVVLRDLAAAEGPGFEITNAELAERCEAPPQAVRARRARRLLGARRLPRPGVRDGEGHGAYRRLTFVPVARARSTSSRSVRYAEGLDEIAEFARVQVVGR